MNQTELIDAIAEKTGLSKKACGDVLRAQGEIAQSALDEPAGELVLAGIGKLKAVEKPARTGRNPATGEEIEIPAKTAVKFVVAKALKDAVA